VSWVKIEKNDLKKNLNHYYPIIPWECVEITLQEKGGVKWTFKYSPRDKILSIDLYGDFQ